MATSGKLNTSAWSGNYGNRYLELAWTRTSFSVMEQTSTIKWTLTSRGSYSGYVSSAPFGVSIDNELVYSSDKRIKLYPNQEIASGTKVVKHNADGTKTLFVSVTAAIYSSLVNVSGTGTYKLDVVGMATITKAPNFNDEDNPKIEYSNPVGNAITSLQAAISLTGDNPDIAYRAIAINGTSYTFALTEEERKILRAATQAANSRKVRFYLRGVIDGAIYFAWKEVTFSVINAQPTVSGSVIDVNSTTVALTGSNTTLIRNHSTAQATISVAAKKEAYITSQTIEHNGSTTRDSNKLYLNVNGNVFAFVATDSRNNTASQTIVAQMIDYIRPTANIDTSAQMDAEGNYSLSVSGNYYNDTFGYTSAAAANTLTVQYRYKAQGGSYSSWVTMAATLNNNTYTATATISGLDYRTAYIVQCRAVDKLNTIQSAEVTMKSLPVFHWSNSDFTFEVPVNFNAGANGITAAASDTGNDVSGDMTITGNLRLKGSGNYGNTLYFGDGSYAYIQEPTDDALTIKASTINLNGNVLVNGSAIGGGSATAGTWQPTLTTAAAVSSYTVRQGWYQKVGNVVTIGWQIKADVKSGYNTTTVSISGLPYTPSYAAFGGGIAHNINLTGGFCFEGWAAGTDGRITARSQPCNGTAAANLQISSTAYYPAGNTTQTLTLAGTLSYITNG